MESIKQQGQNQGFLSQVDDKLGSDQNINTGEFNDQQDGKMITNREGDYNVSRGDRILGRKKDSTNNISPAYKIPIASNNNTSTKQPHMINLTDVTLKSTIICLLLLSLVMVGVYKMIEQVYEISHPELVMNKRLTQSRMNSMVRQENSLSKVTQQHLNYQAQNIIKKENQVKQVRQVRQEQGEKIQEGTKEQQKRVVQQNKGGEVQQKEPDSKGISSQDNIQKFQETPKQQQQHLQVELIKTDQSQQQIIQPKNTYPPEQTKTQINQQQQTTQQQAVKSEHHEDKGQQAQSQLRQKEQFIENYQLKQSDKKKQDQEEQEHAVHKQQEQVKQIEEAKPEDINKKDQPLIQTKEKQNQVPTIPSKPQPPKIQQQVPPRNPPRPSPPHKPQQQPVKPPQPAQRPASSPPVIPTAKANITRQQAIKWRQYEKMIELPLQKQASSNKMLMQEYQYYERKYNISKYNQLPICVVVPTYNNVQNNRYQDNLKSILQQNYTNYHVVIIDDKSSDNTGQKINEYLTTLNPKFSEKIKVIINQQRKMAMPNLRYAAMNECQENQLFIIVDGDDLLIGRQVFKLFSAVMQQRDYWVMWTNFLSPKGAIGYSRQYPAIHKNSNNYRKAGFVMSHLRAYYTKLFRLIKQQDLQDEKGQYFHAANDVAIGVPILEMAHMHAGYVPQISYYYNMYTGLNNHKVRLRQQKANDKLIRKKQKYQALQSLDFDKSETK